MSGDFGNRAKRWRRRLSPVFVIAIISLAGFLLYRTLSQYSFEEIVASVSEIPLTRLGTAGLFAAASYLCLTGFDSLAVRYAGKPLAYHRTALASFTALSIGHNIGFAALSSGAIRYRFYTRWGLSVGEVAKVILFCGLTVGLGLIVLGGVAILVSPDLASEITGLRQGLVLALGAGCLALAAIYATLAAFVRGTIGFRGWMLEMPSIRLALAQLVIGPLNFALVAACLHQTLSAVVEVPYVSAVTVFVIANAGVLASHVPGGLGVIESVVTFLLPQADLIGALLVFRFVYFLVPLMIGGTTFVLSEAILKGRETRRASQA